MADSTDQGDKKENKSGEVDLSGLQNFNFATNWSEAPAAPSGRGDRDSSERGRGRPDRRPSGGKRPPGRERGGDTQQGRGADRRPQGERSDRPAGDDRRQAPGDRRDRGFDRSRRDRPQVPLWKESPFEVQVFPDDPIVTTLTRAMRHSLRTYELFEIARLVLEKPDRYHVNVRYKPQGDENRLLHISVPDGLPFVTEEGAIDHVVRNHLDQFFTSEQVEVEPPKGSFQFIARCALTGDFLSPPNYHRYQAILLQYHQERFPDMPFERFRASIETVKDEEAVQKWLQSMTTQTRYKVAGQEEGEAFESLEQARAYLLRQNKDQVVRGVKVVKMSGKRVEEVTDTDIKPYLMSSIDHQKRFPLDTANGLRGRLRRQDFFIYKKGSRGVSFVCAVKRKFRQPGQEFSDSVEKLIKFIEEHDCIHASELAEKFLEVTPPAEGETIAPDAEEKIKRMSIDLRWLLSEGYVTEFSDGRLQSHPVAQPGNSEQAHHEEHSAEGDETQAEGETSPEEETPAAEGNAAAEQAEDQAPAGAGETDAAEEPVAEEKSAEAPAPEPSEKTT